jgi:hypothetical protein
MKRPSLPSPEEAVDQPVDEGRADGIAVTRPR